jgi:uncharacterized protein (DUF58 family)
MQTGYRFLDPQALARLKNLPVVARGVVEGFIAGRHSSPYKGFSAEFAEHREYTAGDDPRRLDYRMLGRTDRLYVKQYEEETNMRVQIVLDTSASMGYGSEGRLSKLTYGCYLTAVLSWLMIRQQDAVGLATFDTRLQVDMPARSSPRHFHEMAERLEALAPGGGTDIAETLQGLANRFKRRGLIVLVSDLYGDSEAIVRALHHFRHRRHEMIVFHVLDPAEVSFPFRDLVALRDLETGERIEIDPAFVRGQYLAEIAALIGTYRRACAEAQIDYVLAETSTPYDFMLSKYLAKRRRP